MSAGRTKGTRAYLVGGGLLGVAVGSAVLVWWTGDPFAFSLIGVYLLVKGAGRTNQ